MVCYVALGLVFVLSAFAVGLASIPLFWVSTVFAALGGGLYTLHCKDAARLSHNALLDAGAAFAMGMIGIALADPMTIAAGGFAGAALMAIARRAAKPFALTASQQKSVRLSKANASVCCRS